MYGMELKKHELAKPGSEAHTRMITSSKVATMLRDEDGEYLGIGYDSAFDLFQYMTGNAKKDITGMEEIFRYGHAAEHFARYWLKETMPGWSFSRGEVAYGFHPRLKFPHQATVDLRARKGRQQRLIEVKAPKVDRGVEDKWVPQAVMNMAVSGIHELQLIVVPRYGEVNIYDIEWDRDLWEAIIEDTHHWWDRMNRGDAPAPGGSALYRQMRGAMFPTWDAKAEPVTLNEGWTQRYAQAVQDLADAEEAYDVVRNEIVDMMGDAYRVNGADGRKIVSRSKGRFSESRVPDEYRNDPQFQTTKFDSSKFKQSHPDLYEEAQGDPGFTFDKKGWVGNE